MQKEIRGRETKARAQISIAASQLVEPMPVADSIASSKVKEIDPISSAVTEPLRDSP